MAITGRAGTHAGPQCRTGVNADAGRREGFYAGRRGHSESAGQFSGGNHSDVDIPQRERQSAFKLRHFGEIGVLIFLIPRQTVTAAYKPSQRECIGNQPQLQIVQNAGPDLKDVTTQPGYDVSSDLSKNVIRSPQ